MVNGHLEHLEWRVAIEQVFTSQSYLTDAMILRLNWFECWIFHFVVLVFRALYLFLYLYTISKSISKSISIYYIYISTHLLLGVPWKAGPQPPFAG